MLKSLDVNVSYEYDDFFFLSVITYKKNFSMSFRLFTCQHTCIFNFDITVKLKSFYCVYLSNGEKRYVDFKR